MRTLNTIIIFLWIFIASSTFAESDKNYTDEKVKEVYESIIRIIGLTDKISLRINEDHKKSSQNAEEIQELQKRIEKL